MFKQGDPVLKIYIVSDGYFQVSRKVIKEIEYDVDQPTALMQYNRPDVYTQVSNMVPKKHQIQNSNLLTLGRGAIIGL